MHYASTEIVFQAVYAYKRRYTKGKWNGKLPGKKKTVVGPHFDTRPSFRAPVWTAFINHYIDSRNWLRRVNNRVLLRDMRQVIFFPEYTPPRNSRGEYILIFTSETGECFLCFSMLSGYWAIHENRCKRLCCSDWTLEAHRLNRVSQSAGQLGSVICSCSIVERQQTSTGFLQEC